MNRILIVAFLIVVFVAFASAQKTGSPFPGVSAAQMKQLQNAKRFTALPLPTWIPAGFKLEKVESKLGSKVPIEERSLVIVYRKTLPDGKFQRFAFEAGFDGLGDLMYDSSKVIPSSVGKIYLVYEPNDPDEGGKKRKNFVMTEWFDVGRTAFHYDGMFGEQDDPSLVMISIPETEKILRSLKRL